MGLVYEPFLTASVFGSAVIKYTGCHFFPELIFYFIIRNSRGENLLEVFLADKTIFIGIKHVEDDVDILAFNNVLSVYRSSDKLQVVYCI